MNRSNFVGGTIKCIVAVCVVSPLSPLVESCSAQSPPPGLNDGLLAHWSFSVPGELQNNDGVSTSPVLRLIPEMDVNPSIGVFPNAAGNGYGALKSLWGGGEVNLLDWPGADGPLLVPEGPAEWSVALWFSTPNSGQMGNIFEVRPRFSAYEFVESPWTCAVIDNSQFSFKWAENWAYFPLAITVGEDWWHHLVISKLTSPDEVRVYVDGVFAGSAFLPGPYYGYPEYSSLSWDNSFVVGGNHGSTPGWAHQMQGALDDFRLYARSLNGQEAAALYDLGAQTARTSSSFTLAGLLGTALGAQDADGDGFTNLTEFLAGSGIFSAGSHPSLTSAAGSAPTVHTRIER